MVFAYQPTMIEHGAVKAAGGSSFSPIIQLKAGGNVVLSEGSQT